MKPSSPALSDLQRAYLRRVLQGYTSKEIARLHGATPKAVDRQLDRARDALGAATRLQAARWAAETEGETSPGAPFPLSSAPPSDRLGPEPAADRVEERAPAFRHDLPAAAPQEPPDDLTPSPPRAMLGAILRNALVLLLLALAVSALMRELDARRDDIFRLIQTI